MPLRGGRGARGRARVRADGRLADRGQRYRIYDAATGLVEEGWVRVADMGGRGPWLEESFDFPVEVIGGPGVRRRSPEPGVAAAPA